MPFLVVFHASFPENSTKPTIWNFKRKPTPLSTSNRLYNPCMVMDLLHSLIPPCGQGKMIHKIKWPLLWVQNSYLSPNKLLQKNLTETYSRIILQSFMKSIHKILNSLKSVVLLKNSSDSNACNEMYVSFTCNYVSIMHNVCDQNKKDNIKHSNTVVVLYLMVIIQCFSQSLKS